jgi:hypothetical protein
MVTRVDEKRGIVEVTWENIRERVSAVEPEFAQLVDELCLDKSYPFYLLYFPYGHLKGDTESSFIPNPDGSYYRLNDPNAPKNIIKNLGYGAKHAPLGMVLEKNFEFYIDLKDEKLTLPQMVYSPGSFLSLSRNLQNTVVRAFISNKVSSLSSGMRSVFMLPNIGCFANHKNLKRDLNIKSPTPRSLYEHWQIFSEIANSTEINSIWRSCIIYFSENFVHKLNNDGKWAKINNYLCRKAFRNYEYERVNCYLEFIFSVMQKKRNLKPNPYLMDTVRHIFITATGVTPGYVIAENENYLPLETIQKAYIDAYGLKSYIPSIVHANYFDFEKDINPAYYSLQYPATHSFSPKSKKIASKMYEMREIEHIVRALMGEFSKQYSICSDTILSDISDKIEFNFFHSERDKHNTIKYASEMPKLDPRIEHINPSYKVEGSTFSVDSPFVRGCISISAKKKIIQNRKLVTYKHCETV